MRWKTRFTNNIQTQTLERKQAKGYAFVFIYIYFQWRCDQTRVMTSSYLMFQDHTQQRATLGRTPLDE
jgi:hypothetical protein